MIPFCTYRNFPKTQAAKYFETSFLREQNFFKGPIPKVFAMPPTFHTNLEKLSSSQIACFCNALLNIQTKFGDIPDKISCLPLLKKTRTLKGKNHFFQIFVFPCSVCGSENLFNEKILHQKFSEEKS